MKEKRKRKKGKAVLLLACLLLAVALMGAARYDHSPRWRQLLTVAGYPAKLGGRLSGLWRPSQDSFFASLLGARPPDDGRSA